jgi:hypothetical protein
VGFGDNNHAIRGLMRFIKITSREFRINDVVHNEGAPNYKRWRYQAQKEVYFILYFEFEYRKFRTIKGDIINLLKCATKCSILYTYILSCSAKTANSTSFYLLLSKARQCRDLFDCWDQGRYSYPFSSLTIVFFNLWPFRPTPTELFVHSLSSPLVNLNSQAFFCDFPINPWEKRLQNSIREQIHWFSKSKSTWFTF